MNNKNLYTISFFGTIIWSIIVFYTMMKENSSSSNLIGYLLFFLVSFSTIYYLYNTFNNKEINIKINQTEYENQLLEKKIEQKKLFEELENLKRK